MKTCRVGIGAECGEPVYPGGEVCAKHFEWYHGRPPPIVRDANVGERMSAGKDEPGPWTTLFDLRSGAIFETRDGVFAVKTRYHSKRGAIDCYLLESGESAWFDQPANRPEAHNATEVREIPPDRVTYGVIAAAVAVTVAWRKLLPNGLRHIPEVDVAVRRLEAELFE